MMPLKDEQKVLAGAAVGAAALWVVDAFIDVFIFGHGSFLRSLLGRISAHELYFRLLFVAGFLLFGYVSFRMLRRRRRVEQDLRTALAEVEDERTKSATVLEAIGDGISIQDCGFRVLYQNAVHKAMIGDSVGRLCYEAYAGKDAVCDGCPVERAFAHGGVHTLEKTNAGPDGGTAIEISASPLRNSRGEIIAGIELVRNIRDRKRLEESIQEQRRFAEAVIENSAVATFVLGPDHRVLIWNKACERLTGIPAGSMVGTTDHWKPFYRERRPVLADIIIDGNTDALQRLYDAVSPSQLAPLGLSAEGWFANLNERERYIIFDAIPIYSSKGELSVVIETIQDITDRKRAEDKLRLFSEVVKEAMDGVQIVDLDGQILYSNPAVEEIYGFTPNDLAGRPVGEMNADPAFAPTVILPALRREGRWSGEVSVKHKDGREFPVWLSASTVRDETGKPMAMVGIIRDITNQKQNEYELEAHREHLEEMVRDRTRELLLANERLQQEMAERKRMQEDLIRVQKVESLSLLAGGIAHDFNNLLASMMGNISLAMLDLPPASSPYQQLASAERAALRARELTLQLLTFSKGGAPVKSYTSLEQLVRETADFSLRGSRSRLTFSFADDLWPVEVDAGQIAQVVNNLIINADQAMPAGGAIRITGENVTLGPDGEIPLREGRYLRITVQDEGTGIPRDHLAKIFDPYFTTKQKGSGLGLAITDSIIQKHDGFISVESTVGAGTTFRIYLPAAAERRTESRPRDAAVLTGGGRILVMDDEPEVLKTTGDILARLGYTVSFASDGAEAVRLYRLAKEKGEGFDLTIMDLTVPGGMGGREAMTELLAMDPAAKAIVSSGYSDDPVMASYADYGFSGFVSKPFRVRELGEAVHRVLNGGA